MIPVHCELSDADVVEALHCAVSVDEVAVLCGEGHDEFIHHNLQMSYQ